MCSTLTSLKWKNLKLNTRMKPKQFNLTISRKRKMNLKLKIGFRV